MASAANDSFLSSDQDTNRFLVFMLYWVIISWVSCAESTKHYDLNQYNVAGDYTIAVQANSCCCTPWGVDAVVLSR